MLKRLTNFGIFPDNCRNFEMNLDMGHYSLRKRFNTFLVLKIGTTLEVPYFRALGRRDTPIPQSLHDPSQLSCDQRDVTNRFHNATIIMMPCSTSQSHLQAKKSKKQPFSAVDIEAKERMLKSTYQLGLYLIEGATSPYEVWTQSVLYFGVPIQSNRLGLILRNSTKYTTYYV